MKQIILLLTFILSVVSITAQNVDRTFKSIEDKNTHFQINVNDGKYIISLYSSEISETTFIPQNENEDSNSHAVILDSNTHNSLLKEDDKTAKIITDGITVTITKSPFQISYYHKDKLITSEKRGYYKSKHEPMDLVSGNIVADETEKIEFNLSEDEVLYGGGARALGMNRRGNRLPLYNRADYGYESRSQLMNYTMPIAVSSKKYMIHFDNAPIGYLDFDSKKDNTLTYETISGRKTYQVIVGNTWLDMLDNYTDLTGKQPMLPRWALGNFSSRFGYHSQEEVETTIAKFKDENIPVDAVILDLYWFGKEIQGTMGNLEVYRDSFPDFEGMVKRLNTKGVKTIAITEPFILSTSTKWDEAVEKDILAKDSIGNPARYDFYFGNTGIIDIYKPEGEKWFWDIYKGLADKGVAGVWGDLGEPEVHPAWVKHHTGSADEVHNTYGHDWARLVFEGYERDFPDTRPFILMRAGYSGSQRYGMIPWSGDVNRAWGGLQSQPEIALQMGMQGLAYMHSDLGGFAGDNLDDELYARWLQYGVFQPIYRPHAQEALASEPVYRSERAKVLSKEAIELRYKLLPYNYNLVYENNQLGRPLMRPLFFEESDNSELFSYSKTYLWGNDMLISPVLEAQLKAQDVYFPKSSKWFDFYTDEIIEGGQTKMVQLKENSIPTYVRAGAFIPMAELVQTTESLNSNRLEIHYFHDTSVEESERKFYFDNGKTPNAFEKEAYQILEFEAEIEGRWLEIDLEAETGSNYNAETKNIQLVFHNIKKIPKRIKVENEKTNGTYREKDKTLSLSINWNTLEEKTIRIKFKK